MSPGTWVNRFPVDADVSSGAVTNPKAMRVQVKGDILSLDKPASTWLTHFKKIEKFDVSASLLRLVILLMLRTPAL